MSIRILGPDDPALAALANVLRRHPEGQVELKILPWVEYQPALEDALDADVSPYQAVCVPGHVWLPVFADHQRIAAFEPLLEKLPDEVFAGYDSKDLMTSVADETRYGGQTYLLPLFTDGHLLFFNRDFLDLENGANVSPFELGRIATSLSLPTVVSPLALKAHPSEILLDWLPFLWEAGGDVLTSDGAPGFAGLEGVEALEYYVSLKKYCPSQPETYGNTEIAAALCERRVALATSWGGQASVIFAGQANLGVALFPRPWNATWGLCLPANQPEVIQLSVLEHLLVICGTDLDREVTKIAGSPVRMSSYAQEEQTRYPWLAAQGEMLQRAGNLPADPRLSRFLGDLYAAVYEAFTEHMTPKAALRQAEAKAARVLAV